MSRLQEHQKKEYTRKLVFFVIILGLLIVFMVTVGLKLVISSTIFISNLTAPKNQTTQQTSDNFFGTLEINSIPQATNSAKFVISGTSTNYEKLTFYVNDESVKELDSVSNDSFTETIGDLKKGSNEVYVVANAKQAKAERKSNIFTVVYTDSKPKLEISEPQDNSKTGNSDLAVSGKTDKEIFIRVNDQPVVVDAQGNFKTSVRLKDGDNKIEVVAQDNAGNTETKILTVTYHKDE
ncbi:hypothetical protein HGA88_03575 [Candidatus Roizmanbacteria bacterium]|nr:hypothetical protein [Candidatus Roizmanbacteria bacterium]